MSSIKTVPRPDGNQPRTSPLVRLCRTCGKRVCKYKNPSAKSTLCYCCEDKLPWTYALIAGGGTFAEDPKNRRKHAMKVVVTDDQESSEDNVKISSWTKNFATDVLPDIYTYAAPEVVMCSECGEDIMPKDDCWDRFDPTEDGYTFIFLCNRCYRKMGA